MTLRTSFPTSALALLCLLAAAPIGPAAHAQQPPPAVPATGASTTPSAPAAAAPAAAAASASPAAAAAAPTLASLDWIGGCWQGTVNKREFREVWLPQRGGMMLGVSQTVSADKTLDYEYLRLETRADGVYYVASPPGKPEQAFRLTGATVDKEDAQTYSFTDPAREFPQRIGYRRASEGWLYIEVEGKVKGADRKVYYPMRRVDCESGEFLKK